jgi:hypothetical protein
MSTRNKLLAALGITALAVPAAAIADSGHGNHRGGSGKNPAVTFVFKGAYAGDGSTVHVSHGNGHVKRAGLVGQDVTFDFSSAKISVADTNSDTVSDLSDVLTDDKVVVQARLPKSDAPVQPIVARHLVDQTNTDEGDDGADDSTD